MSSLPLRRSLVGVVTLSVALLGAGCEEEDPSDPVTSPSETSESAPTSPSEPTTTDAGPVEPTLPSEAAADNQRGVEAFVEFYWSVVNYATKTGDVGLLRELDQPSCEGCAGGVEGIESVYSRGGRIVGGDYSVVRLEPVQSASGRWTVVTHTEVGTQRAIDAGDLNRRFPAGRDKWLIALARVQDAWTVSTLEPL